VIDAHSPQPIAVLRLATRLVLILGLLAVASVFTLVPAASAHGEIIDASPGDDEIVGGEITEISIQFVGIAHPGDHTVSVTDPDGVTVASTGSLEQDFLRLNLPIEPLTKPGPHTVTAVIEGIDDDTTTLTYSFDYQPGAPPPEPIQFEQERPGLDAITIGLMALTAASIIGFIFYIRHRLRITAPTAEADDDDDDIDNDNDNDNDDGGPVDDAEARDED